MMPLTQENSIAEGQAGETLERSEGHSQESHEDSLVASAFPSSSHVPFTTDADLERLRQLLFSHEITALSELKKRLDDPLSHAQDLSRVVAEAILLRTKQDDRLALALQPTVEAIFKDSVKNNPAQLANSLFPLMGPAIRKAIAEAFHGMLQGFNKTIEQIFSWKGLRWRFEALRTGKPFSEVVLLHTLLYQVDQVFLIHSSTGLLLAHAIEAGVEHQDGDLVSGMLTAIQDFVRDCFSVGENESLDTLQMGDKSLLVEKGSDVSLALVVRGTLPSDFRNKVRDILDVIHIEMSVELVKFSGDTAPFANVQHYLESCLGGRYLGEDASVPFWLKCIPALVLLTIIGAPTYAWYEQRRFHAAIRAVDTEPGIAISGSFGNILTGWEVFITRDPLSQDVHVLLEKAGLDVSRVVVHETPFASLEPELVTMRLRKAMDAPETVTLSFVDGVLHLEGQASLGWILATKERALGIPGVEQVDTAKIIDPRTQELLKLVHTVESLRIEFPLGKDMPEGQELVKLQQAIAALAELSGLATKMGIAPTLIIYGHTDATGTDKRNYELSEGRAKTLASMLYAKGVAMPIATYGFGAQYALDHGTDAKDVQQQSRRIELKIHLSYLGNSLISLDNI